MVVENGHKKTFLETLVENCNSKMKSNDSRNYTNSKKIPWVPKMNRKLEKLKKVNKDITFALSCINLTADPRLKQKTFQSALVSLFSLCMLETVTTLLSSHVINSITNFPSNTPKMLGKYLQSAKLCNTLASNIAFK